MFFFFGEHKIPSICFCVIHFSSSQFKIMGERVRIRAHTHTHCVLFFEGNGTIGTPLCHLAASI